MREVLTMWRDTRMIMLTAVVAAVYAAVLIPFKGLTIIPGFTSVRPANVFPIIFSLLFGPAAAWGSAIGNLIGDIFGGTFGPASFFGFIGNFFFGFVGYKLWGNLGPLSSGEEPDFRSNTGRQLLEYLVVALVGATITAAIIAWGVDLLGLVPFPVLGVTITVNNFIAAAILGPPLLYLTWPRVKELGLLYPEILRDDDLSDVASSRRQTAAYGIAVVAIVWVFVGIFIASPQSTFQRALGAIGFILVLGFAIISGERLSKLVEY